MTAKVSKAEKIAIVNNALDRVFTGSYTQGISESTIADAIAYAIKTRVNWDEVRKQYHVGRIAASMQYAAHSNRRFEDDAARIAFDRSHARAAYEKKGNPKKNPGHDDTRRSPAEERAYGASRVALTALMKKYGIKSPSSQGGDRTGDGEDAAKRMSVDGLVAPKFKVETSLELAAWCKAHASQGYDFFLKNKSHPAVASELGAALMGAFADHIETIKAIIGKFEPAK